MAGEPRGTLYCGDCLDVMERRIAPESVDLVYADPPFFTNRKYEVIWGDEGEVRSFEDRWEGGIEVYVAWMTERLRACHRVLKPTGSLYLHCDWHASHYLKVAVDVIFGRDNFQNEIVWYYRGGGASKRRYARRHDVILWYSKGGEWCFDPDPVRTPYSEESLARLKYEARAFRKDKDGNERVYEGYRPDARGKLPDDVWIMQPIMPSSKERIGYPTQKPERLLERVLLAGSKPGHLVLDPFCGCGTTLVAAERLGRRWIGIDISPTATRVIKERLGTPGSKEVEVFGLPTTVADVRALAPFEFQNWVVRDRFNGVVGPRGGDKGVDGYSFMVHDPIQVKQSDGVGRNVVDNFHSAIRRAGKRKGWIVALGFGKGAHEEAARVKREEKIEIVLLTVDELLAKPIG